MRITVKRNTTRHRRQRWTFELGPTSQRSEDTLTWILYEYALEIEEEPGKWTRPKVTWYHRAGANGAAMPHPEVPELDMETRLLLHHEIARCSVFQVQSVHGVTRL